MDVVRKSQVPSLVCTCSDLYVDEIQQAIDDGEEDYVEILQYNYTLPRCGECQCHVEQLVAATDA
jgi:bacterioferritin-associated ferredoxin